MFLYTILCLLGVCMGVPSGDRAPKDMLEEFKINVKGCKTFPVEKLLDNPKFVTECKDKLTPDLQNISTIQDFVSSEILLDPNPLLCYAVFESVGALCSQDTPREPVQVQEETPESFCKDQGNIKFPEKCSVENCEMLRLLAEQVLLNPTQCGETCVKSKLVFPACQYLSISLATLFPGSVVAGGANTETEKINVKTVGSGEKIKPDLENTNSPKLDQNKKDGSTESEGEKGLSNSNPATTLTSEKTSKVQDEKSSKGAAETSPLAVETSPPVEETDLTETEDQQQLINGQEEEMEDQEERKEDQEEGKEDQEDGLEDQEELDEEEIKAEVEKGSDPHEEGIETVEDALDAREEEMEAGGDGIDARLEGTGGNKNPGKKGEDTMNVGVFSEDKSNFMVYFFLLSIVSILAYLVFHNKQKILALILEGRRQRGSRRRSEGREYRKLDSSVEESMDLNRDSSQRQVIY